MNHLTDNFYAQPNIAATTMTTKQLRETLLATDGTILACGYLYDIKHKALGAGVHRVFLKKQSD